MRKIAVTFMIACLGVVLSIAGIDSEPIPQPEPEPIQISDMQTVKQWELTKAYYRRVKMPDGTTQELKSFKPLKDKQWLELANTVYKAQLESEKEPEICPCCGQPIP